MPNKLNQTDARKFNTGENISLPQWRITIYNEVNTSLGKHEININLTMSSPISGVILMLLLLNLRASDVDAPSDL